MNSKQVLDFITNPTKLQKAEAEELQRVTQEYPYSGMLQALYLKALKNQNNYLYPKQLKRTAISVPDRKVLYYWTEGEVLTEVTEEIDKPTLVFKAEEKETPKEKPHVVEEKKVQPEVGKAEKPKDLQPETPPETPKPKAVAKAAETTKTDDLDLAGLPASVRETVLRARKIREQIGHKYDDEAPKPQSQESPKSTPEPAKPAVEPKPEPIVTPAKKEEKPVAEELSKPEPETEANPPGTERVSEPAAQQELVEEAHSVPEPQPATAKKEPIAVKEEKPEPIKQPERPQVEMHSFLDWLDGGETDEDILEETAPSPEPIDEIDAQKIPEPQKHTESEDGKKEEQLEEKPSTEHVKDLYESFMETRPKPKLTFRAESRPVDAASLSTSPYSQYITETLAQIYIEQKLYDRALNAYEILRLKYPEKSSFFAGRIAEIKKILNENDW